MKHKLYILALFITIFSCKAQEIVNIDQFNQGNNEGKYFKDINNVFDNFLGTWEHKDGNIIFRVTLTKLTKHEHKNGNRPSFYEDHIQGHFEKVEVNSKGIETLVYTSQKKMGQTITDWPFVIYGGTNDGIRLSAQIDDNSITQVGDHYYITGVLKCEIIPNTNPKQMTWKVALPLGMRDMEAPDEFNIPTDIILTKQ